MLVIIHAVFLLINVFVLLVYVHTFKNNLTKNISKEYYKKEQKSDNTTTHKKTKI